MLPCYHTIKLIYFWARPIKIKLTQSQIHLMEDAKIIIFHYVKTKNNRTVARAEDEAMKCIEYLTKPTDPNGKHLQTI